MFTQGAITGYQRWEDEAQHFINKDYSEHYLILCVTFYS